MSRRYTLDEIMALKPCYSRERLQQYFPKGTITASQITKADVPHSDKLWVLIRLLRPADFVTFACDCAERVLPIFEKQFPKDSRPRKAIEAARRGGDKAAAAAAAEAEEDAWDAAWAATWAATWDAAWDAAAEAARAAVDAAEATAAEATAAEAAEAAAWAAWTARAAAGDAGAAEQKWQLKKLLQLIHAAEENNNQPF